MRPGSGDLCDAQCAVIGGASVGTGSRRRLPASGALYGVFAGGVLLRGLGPQRAGSEERRDASFRCDLCRGAKEGNGCVAGLCSGAGGLRLWLLREQ